MPLQITTVAWPSGKLDVTGTVEMVKASLLLADKVILRSVELPFLLALRDDVDVGPRDLARLMGAVAPMLGNPELGTVLSNELFLTVLTSPTNPRYKELQAVLVAGRERLVASVDRVLEQPGFPELIRLRELGILSVEPLIHDIANITEEGFVKTLGEIVAGDGYVMMDTEIRRSIEIAIREKFLSAEGVPRGPLTTAGLSKEVLSRVRLDHVTVDELLDIRTHLDPYRTRFFRTVSEAAAIIENMPWDRHFAAEANHLIETRIEPEAEAIRAALRDASIQRLLFAGAAQEVRSPLASGIISGVGTLGFAIASWPVWAVAALIMTGTTGSVALRTWHSYISKRQEVKEKDVFFYYEAQRLSASFG